LRRHCLNGEDTVDWNSRLKPLRTTLGTGHRGAGKRLLTLRWIGFRGRYRIQDLGPVAAAAMYLYEKGPDVNGYSFGLTARSKGASGMSSHLSIASSWEDQVS
jgi:hypothetical protein